MNICKLFKKIQENGVDEITLKFSSDDYRGSELKEMECHPDTLKEDDLIPADFVKEVLGTENPEEMSLWELVERAALLTADHLAGGWDEVEVTFNIWDGEVGVRGWSRNEFSVSQTVAELQ